MRDTACLVDQSTNSYCYVEAVRNTNPSDLYFYQLPLGTKLPADTKPSCSACTKSVMQLYSQAQSLMGLQTTYNAAASLADTACGAGYVQEATITGGATALPLAGRWTLVLVPLVVAVVGWW